MTVFLNNSSISCVQNQCYCSCRVSFKNITNQQFLWETNHLFSSSPKLMISTTKNSRVKTGKKSNAELCTELQEFVSMLGFPQGHVPSFKDLSHHGRKDLAYIVRRRGYKLITELLTKSTKENMSTEKFSAEIQNPDSCQNEIVGEVQEMSELAEGLFLSSDDSNIDNCFSSENGVSSVASGTEDCRTSKPGTSSFSLEKASKFIKDGELEKIEDHNLEIGQDTSTTNDRDEQEIISDGHYSDNTASEYNGTSVMNASSPTSKLVLPSVTHSDDFSLAEGFNNTLPQNDLDVQASARENDYEINRLKTMLHQKELELYQLKQQIEKEKLALSTLQAKVENEIGKAETIMSAKDEELHTAEESLFGLKEVQIEYWGHGENVEVAGSFNGWHHRIKLDSQPSAMSGSPSELRKSRLWSTVLWLYPGIYEVKFVVDGHWMIDPQRESVTRGTIQNNIIRVDR
ncbi:hypothetical protein AQUCO_06200018v1 [Aquilegia coerulea]|uniref:AMP-activated protein kinase glycogen-binding domain-containing protein n=1 Tax=Aquilegia coerulea TaxID=218851 RepID=A0A2G5CCY9_AQUCA|nr:hypothetical protein AQUCO_06200018v1 [Aquilegia coerulea]